MAVIYKGPKEEEGVIAPKKVTAPAEEAPAGALGAVPTVPKAPSATAPAAPKAETPASRKSSGMFVNLKKYEQANVGEGQRLAETLAKNVEATAAKGMAEFGKAEQQYRRAAVEQNIEPDLDFIMRTAQKIQSGELKPGDVDYERFQRMATSHPGGPTGLTADTTRLNQLRDKQQAGTLTPEEQEELQKEEDKFKRIQEDIYTPQFRQAIQERVQPYITSALESVERLAPTKQTTEEMMQAGRKQPEYLQELQRQFMRPTYTAGQTLLDKYLLEKAPYAESRFARLKETLAGSQFKPSTIEQINRRIESAQQFARERQYGTALANALVKQVMYGVNELPKPEEYLAISGTDEDSVRRRTEIINSSKTNLDQTEKLLGELMEGQRVANSSVEAARREVELAKQRLQYIDPADQKALEFAQQDLGIAQQNLEQALQTQRFYDDAVSNAYTAREYYRTTYNDMVTLHYQVMKLGEQPPVIGVALPFQSRYGAAVRAAQVARLNQINDTLASKELTEVEENRLLTERDELLRLLTGVQDLSTLKNLPDVYRQIGAQLPGRSYREKQRDINLIDEINKRLETADMTEAEERDLLFQRDSALKRLADDYGISVEGANFDEVYARIKVASQPTITQRQIIDKQINDFIEKYNALDVETKEALMDYYMEHPELLSERAKNAIQPLIDQYNQQFEAKKQEYLRQWQALPNDAAREAVLNQLKTDLLSDNPSIRGRERLWLLDQIHLYEASVKEHYANLTNQFNSFVREDGSPDILAQERFLASIVDAVEGGMYTGQLADDLMSFVHNYRAHVEEVFKNWQERFNHLDEDAKEQEIEAIQRDIEAGHIAGTFRSYVEDEINKYNNQVTNEINTYKSRLDGYDVTKPDSILDKEKDMEAIELQIQSGQIRGRRARELQAYIDKYKNSVLSKVEEIQNTLAQDIPAAQKEAFLNTALQNPLAVGLFGKQLKAIKEKYYADLQTKFEDMQAKLNDIPDVPDNYLAREQYIEDLQKRIDSGEITGWLKERLVGMDGKSGLIGAFYALQEGRINTLISAFNDMPKESQIETFNALSKKEQLSYPEKQAFNYMRLALSKDVPTNYMAISAEDLAKTTRDWERTLTDNPLSLEDVVTRFFNGDYRLSWDISAAHDYLTRNVMIYDPLLGREVPIGLQMKLDETIREIDNRLWDSLEAKLASGQQLTGYEALMYNILRDDRTLRSTADYYFKLWKSNPSKRDAYEVTYGNNPYFQRLVSQQKALERAYFGSTGDGTKDGLLYEITQKGSGMLTKIKDTIQTQINAAQKDLNSAAEQFLAKYTPKNNYTLDINITKALFGTDFYWQNADGSANILGLKLSNYIRIPKLDLTNSGYYVNADDLLKYNNLASALKTTQINMVTEKQEPVFDMAAFYKDYASTMSPLLTNASTQLSAIISNTNNTTQISSNNTAPPGLKSLWPYETGGMWGVLNAFNNRVFGNYYISDWHKTDTGGYYIKIDRSGTTWDATPIDAKQWGYISNIFSTLQTTASRILRTAGYNVTGGAAFFEKDSNALAQLPAVNEQAANTYFDNNKKSLTYEVCRTSNAFDFNSKTAKEQEKIVNSLLSNSEFIKRLRYRTYYNYICQAAATYLTTINNINTKYKNSLNLVTYYADMYNNKKAAASRKLVDLTPSVKLKL